VLAAYDGAFEAALERGADFAVVAAAAAPAAAAPRSAASNGQDGQRFDNKSKNKRKRNKRHKAGIAITETALVYVQSRWDMQESLRRVFGPH